MKQCFVCGDMGADDVAGGVHKCHSSNCGKFYHQHCVSQLPLAVITKKQDEVRSSDKNWLCHSVCVHSPSTSLDMNWSTRYSRKQTYNSKEKLQLLSSNSFVLCMSAASAVSVFFRLVHIHSSLYRRHDVSNVFCPPSSIVGKGKEQLKYRSKLFPCWHCPTAFHENCIPPLSKHHEYLLLCPDHSHHDLPHLPGWGDDDPPEKGRLGPAVRTEVSD